jgi:hypothetical protein
MGFTVNAPLFGLPSLSWYVTIKGTFTIEKNIFMAGNYRITYTTYYSTGADQPVIKHDVLILLLQQLPEPPDIYTTIYNEIKKIINPNNIYIIDDV